MKIFGDDVVVVVYFIIHRKAHLHSRLLYLWYFFSFLKKVSTNAGLISHFVNLQIVVPEATIQGTRSGEHHVDIGSIIDLVCIIEKVRNSSGATQLLLLAAAR